MFEWKEKLTEAKWTILGWAIAVGMFGAMYGLVVFAWFFISDIAHRFGFRFPEFSWMWSIIVFGVAYQLFIAWDRWKYRQK